MGKTFSKSKPKEEEPIQLFENNCYPRNKLKKSWWPKIFFWKSDIYLLLFSLFLWIPATIQNSEKTQFYFSQWPTRPRILWEPKGRTWHFPILGSWAWQYQILILHLFRSCIWHINTSANAMNYRLVTLFQIIVKLATSWPHYTQDRDNGSVGPRLPTFIACQ